MLFTFLLSSAIDVNHDWEALRFLTPFKYFPAKDMMLGSGWEGFAPFYTALALALTALLTCAAYWFFRRRDLRV